MNLNIILNHMSRHLYKTVNYDRSKGVLTKADYVYMRDLLENVLEQLQNSELDNDREIDQLKQFFIKLDHHIDRLRV